MLRAAAVHDEDISAVVVVAVAVVVKRATVLRSWPNAAMTAFVHRAPPKSNTFFVDLNELY